MIGLFHITDILIIPGISNVLSAIPLNEVIGGTLLGILIGGIMVWIFAFYSREKINEDHVSETNIPKQDIYYFS